jgi:tetratricopeptide (TPR) repeat protein
MYLSAETEWTSHEVYLIASKGYALYLQGRWREAAMIFEGLVAIDPGNRYLRLALATIYVAQEDLTRSLEELNRLLSLYPNDIEARARRCEVCLRLERSGEAQSDLDYLRRHGGSHVRRLQLLMETKVNPASNTSESI